MRSFLRQQHESTNFLILFLLFSQPQSKRKTFNDLEMTKKFVYIKPLKNSTLPYLNEISPRVIHEKTKGYDVIGVDVFRLP